MTRHILFCKCVGVSLKYLITNVYNYLLKQPKSMEKTNTILKQDSEEVMWAKFNNSAMLTLVITIDGAEVC